LHNATSEAFSTATDYQTDLHSYALTCKLVLNVQCSHAPHYPSKEELAIGQAHPQVFKGFLRRLFTERSALFK
jgi:hypothetical protein